MLVHANETPVAAELATMFKVAPSHNGELLVTIKTPGAAGSVSVNGPTIFEGHPFNVTEILL